MPAKVCGLLLTFLCCASVARAVTYTATNNANWNTVTTWDPNGIPGSGDLAIIPVGKTVTYGGSPSIAGAVQISGTFSISGAGTLGDVWIDSTGVFNPTTSGANVIFSGSVTNNGSMTITSLGSATPYTYTGTDKFLVGNISNIIAVINGTYRNLGTFVVGLKGTQDAFKGSGGFTNLATLILSSGQNTTPSIAALDCSTPGNVVNWTGFNGTPTPKAITYYDLVLGHTGSAGWQLGAAGFTITHTLTIVNNAQISAWPANGSIPSLTYSASSTTASTFPAAFSIDTFNQTAGKLTVPAGGTLTVTGTGAGTWTRSGGTFSPVPSGTVRFTGAAPDIGGSVVNTFSSLLIDSTATGATASGAGLNVSNTLTIAASGSLDVTALSGSAHAMLGTESFLGSGTLKGSVTTISGAKVYAGLDGGYGANQITADINMASGATFNLDVNTTAAGANDQVNVGGALTLNSTAFRLKAPSLGAAIDTANDYTLATAASISGTPVLSWVTPPASSNSYALVVSATAIKLHYGGTLGSPTLGLVKSGGSLTLSWNSASFPGYILQSETNTLSLNTGWGAVPGGSSSPVIVPIDPANRAVFFRLYHP